jgi:1-acyl-sn-glycerol-3-phosphate acyltransferase
MPRERSSTESDDRPKRARAEGRTDAEAGTAPSRRAEADTAKEATAARKSVTAAPVEELAEVASGPPVGGALVPLALHDEPAEERPEPRRSDVDEWGRSEHMREIARRFYDPIYRHWFRAEWEGLEKIPTDGGALLVANHAGAIPSDAPVIMHGIETELQRPVYGLADNYFRSMPVVGTLWSRFGGLQAHPDNAYRLLHDRKQLVLVFPEGSKGPGKLFNERYQLRRFGRGGFVEIAMRAGVPVVPIAVVGAEESMPTITQVPGLAKLIGAPYVPITANLLLLGPLGAVAYFPAKFRLKVLDPVHFDVPPDQERYSRSRVMEESEGIRERIQEELYEMLRDRESVWFG